jgi:putative oxidoreductase
MIDSIATAPAPVDNTAGVKAMSRLADRLLAAAPPSAPQFSPAVTAALSRNAAMSARAERRARRSRSIIGIVVDSFVSACSFIPYALVALTLRLVMARLFFLDGQTKIDGPLVPLNVHGFDLSVVLPLHVKAETVTAFFAQYAALPVPAVLAAYLVSYAEFILPICLLLGFATRFAALGMLIMTALIQLYVVPDALWTAHVYWAAILLVLLTRGPGQISVDHIIRFIARR